MIKRLSLSLLACLALAIPALAQPTAQYVLDQTTAASTVGATDTVVNVASTSASTSSSFGNIVVGWTLYMDKEAMRVTAINGTALTVTRGRTASGHANGEVIYAGPPGQFKAADPALGTCTASSFPYPWINTNTGELFECTNALVQAYTLSIPVAPELNRTPIAGGNYTALPSDYLIAYTTLSGGVSLTLPSAVGLTGKVIMVKDEGFKLLSRSVTLTLVGTIDGATNLVLTQDYATSAPNGAYFMNGGLVRLYSNGVSWFTW